MCCSVLQCDVVVCCGVLLYAAVCRSVLRTARARTEKRGRKELSVHPGQRVVCCSVLKCVAVCCNVLQCVAVYCSVLQCAKTTRGNELCVAMCYILARASARKRGDEKAVRVVCCNCVAVCCSVVL